MVASYLPDQMLRNLAPRQMTNAQQREADEQLGTVVAAFSRGTGRIVRRAKARARLGGAGTSSMSFRKNPSAGAGCRVVCSPAARPGRQAR